MVDALVQGTMALIVLLSIMRGKAAILWTAGFLLPLQGIQFSFGIAVDWVAIYSVVLFVASLRWVNRSVSFPGLGRFLSFTIWAIAVTMWFWLVDSEAAQLVDQVRTDLGWGAAQTTYRYVVQLISVLLILLATYSTFRLVHSRRDFSRLAKGFVSGNVLSILVGMAQGLVGYNLAGPSGAGPANPLTDYGGLSIGGLYIPRLFGLGGEPKHTAAFATLALALLLARTIAGQAPIAARWTSPVLLFGLLLTLSTSGWISAILLVTLFAARTLSRDLSPRSTARLGTRSALTFALTVAGIVVILTQFQSTIVQERLVTRLSSVDSLRVYEYKDAAMFDYLQDHPTTAVFGHGVGGIDFFLVPYVIDYLYKPGTITPSYVVSRLVGEIGLLGLTLFIALIIRWRSRLRQVGDGAGSLFVTLGGLAILLAPFVAFPAFMILSGGLLGQSTASMGDETASKKRSDTSVDDGESNLQGNRETDLIGSGALPSP